MIFTVLFLLVSASMSKAAYLQNDPINVDVFTQREPYSGKGANMPSDAFGPEDVVILYALVTQNDSPVNDILVGFDVKLPNDAHFSISARTNTSGIATANFTMTTPPLTVSESDIFGIWLITAGVLFEGRTYQDTLSFKVDWIVKLLSVKTIDENLTDRDHFGRGGDVGLQITLRSIAMTLRNAAIEILIKDELNVPVNSSEIEDFAVQPNEKIIFLYCRVTLPKWAYIGSSTVFISAFATPANQSVVPYCPTISTTFMITGETPLEIDYHDVAVVGVFPSAKTIEIGQGLKLKTLVRNEGTVAESFTVSTYFDNVQLGTSQITDLSPYSTAIFEFTVDISLLTVGNHTISAYIPPVPHEADLTDNNFSDTIEVKSAPPTMIDDIAVTNVTLSSNSVFIGDVLEINVTVLNNGTESENFDLSTYYDSSLIETRQVNALAPLSQVLVTFSWHTNSAKEGLYQISASAPLPNDTSPGDNTLLDGFVQVKPAQPAQPAQPAPSFPLLGTFIILMFMMGIIGGLILLLMLGFLRRRKKKRLRHRYIIISHPHI
jgi:hypothetical protein